MVVGDSGAENRELWLILYVNSRKLNIVFPTHWVVPNSSLYKYAPITLIKFTTSKSNIVSNLNVKILRAQRALSSSYLGRVPNFYVFVDP